MRRADQIYDGCFVGGSLLSLLYADKLARLGRRVAVLDRNERFGGAWRAATVLDRPGWENAPHFLTTPKCVGSLTRLFGDGAVQPVANTLYLDWGGDDAGRARLLSELEYKLMERSSALLSHLRAGEMSALPLSCRHLAGAAFYALKQKWYFKNGSGAFADAVVGAIADRGGFCGSGLQVDSVSPAAEDAAAGPLRVRGDRVDLTARAVYLPRHAIVPDLMGQRFGPDSYATRQRRALFLEISEPARRDFYLVHAFNGAPFNFITNTAAVFSGSGAGGGPRSGPVVALMVRSDGFAEDFGDGADSIDAPSVDPNATDDKTLGDMAFERLQQAGLFSKSAAVTARDSLRIDDSSYSRSAIERIKALAPGRLMVPDTTDAAALIFYGMPLEGAA